MAVLGLIGCAAGGVESLRASLVEPLLRAGWQVAVTLTPTAATWLDATGESSALAALTGLPVRSQPRLPSEPRPHPPYSAVAVVPASAGSVAKLALGIADNQAMTTACEAIGMPEVPVLVYANLNAANTNHPSWNTHTSTLERAAVNLLTPPDLPAPREPRASPYPWPKLLSAIDALHPDREPRA